jgi:hypothetical protein
MVFQRFFSNPQQQLPQESAPVAVEAPAPAPVVAVEAPAPVVAVEAPAPAPAVETAPELAPAEPKPRKPISKAKKSTTN